MTQKNLIDISKGVDKKLKPLSEITHKTVEYTHLEESILPIKEEPVHIYYPHELGITCIENELPINTILRR